MVKIFGNYFMCACNVFNVHNNDALGSSLAHTVLLFKVFKFSLAFLSLYLYRIRLVCLHFAVRNKSLNDLSGWLFHLIRAPSTVPLRFSTFCDAILLFGVFLLRNSTPVCHFIIFLFILSLCRWSCFFIRSLFLLRAKKKIMYT